MNTSFDPEISPSIYLQQGYHQYLTVTLLSLTYVKIHICTNFASALSHLTNIVSPHFFSSCRRCSLHARTETLPTRNLYPSPYPSHTLYSSRLISCNSIPGSLLFFFASNIEKLGGAWGRGYVPIAFSTVLYNMRAQ